MAKSLNSQPASQSSNTSTLLKAVPTQDSNARRRQTIISSATFGLMSNQDHTSTSRPGTQAPNLGNTVSLPGGFAVPTSLVRTIEASDPNRLESYATRIGRMEKLLTALVARNEKQTSLQRTQAVYQTKEKMTELELLFMDQGEIKEHRAAAIIQSAWKADVYRKNYCQAMASVRAFHQRDLQDFRATIQVWLTGRSHYYQSVREYKEKWLKVHVRQSIVEWHRITKESGQTKQRLLEKRRILSRRHLAFILRQHFEAWRDMSQGQFSRKCIRQRWKELNDSVHARLYAEALDRGETGGISQMAVREAALEEMEIIVVQEYQAKQQNLLFEEWRKRIEERKEKREMENRAIEWYTEWSVKGYFRVWKEQTEKCRKKGLMRFGKRKNMRVAVYRRNIQRLRLLFTSWRTYSHGRQQAKKRYQLKERNWMKTVWDALWTQVQAQHEMRENVLNVWMRRTISLPRFYFQQWQRYVYLRWAEKQTTNEIALFLRRRSDQFRKKTCFEEWVRVVKEEKMKRKKQFRELELFRNSMERSVVRLQDDTISDHDGLIDAHDQIVAEMSDALKIAQNAILTREQDLMEKDEEIVQLHLKLVVAEEEARKARKTIETIAQTAKKKKLETPVKAPPTLQPVDLPSSVRFRTTSRTSQRSRKPADDLESSTIYGSPSIASIVKNTSRHKMTPKTSRGKIMKVPTRTESLSFMKVDNEEIKEDHPSTSIERSSSTAIERSSAITGQDQFHKPIAQRATLENNELHQAVLEELQTKDDGIDCYSTLPTGAGTDILKNLAKMLNLEVEPEETEEGTKDTGTQTAFGSVQGWNEPVQMEDRNAQTSLASTPNYVSRTQSGGSSAETKRLQSLLTEKENEFRSLQETLEHTDSKAKELEANLNKAQSEKQGLLVQIDDLTEQNNRHSGELEALKDQLSTNKTNTEKEINSWKAMVNEKQAEYESMRNRWEKEKKDLDKKYSTTLVRVKSKDEEIAKLESTISELQKTLKRAELRISQMESAGKDESDQESMRARDVGAKTPDPPKELTLTDSFVLFHIRASDKAKREAAEKAKEKEKQKAIDLEMKKMKDAQRERELADTIREELKIESQKEKEQTIHQMQNVLDNLKEIYSKSKDELWEMERALKEKEQQEKEKEEEEQSSQQKPQSAQSKKKALQVEVPTPQDLPLFTKDAWESLRTSKHLSPIAPPPALTSPLVYTEIVPRTPKSVVPQPIPATPKTPHRSPKKKRKKKQTGLTSEIDNPFLGAIVQTINSDAPTTEILGNLFSTSVSLSMYANSVADERDEIDQVRKQEKEQHETSQEKATKKEEKLKALFREEKKKNIFFTEQMKRAYGAKDRSHSSLEVTRSSIDNQTSSLSSTMGDFRDVVQEDTLNSIEGEHRSNPVRKAGRRSPSPPFLQRKKTNEVADPIRSTSPPILTPITTVDITDPYTLPAFSTDFEKSKERRAKYRSSMDSSLSQTLDPLDPSHPSLFNPVGTVSSSVQIVRSEDPLASTTPVDRSRKSNPLVNSSDIRKRTPQLRLSTVGVSGEYPKMVSHPLPLTVKSYPRESPQPKEDLRLSTPDMTPQINRQERAKTSVPEKRRAPADDNAVITILQSLHKSPSDQQDLNTHTHIKPRTQPGSPRATSIIPPQVAIRNQYIGSRRAKRENNLKTPTSSFSTNPLLDDATSDWALPQSAILDAPLD
ncbi:hypothetical protein BLNAU_6388 [Blattamonas nauphoetae]|uniref:Sfi1 spindle body domain-containing protein n=1 Tax=Blattamonas nauphoetae TaxID=2049346 RepID=A0ABQ9Y4H8_9EUKA|nr:hypothetical protein BLNAU_6388 [Blattamonas nauphoetae]